MAAQALSPKAQKEKFMILTDVIMGKRIREREKRQYRKRVPLTEHMEFIILPFLKSAKSPR